VRRGLDALAFPLPHELFILAVPGRGGRIRGQTAGPLRDRVAHSGRELLVDGPAAGDAARDQREDDQGWDAETVLHFGKSSRSYARTAR